MIVFVPWSPPCCDALVAISLAEMLSSSHGTKAKKGASAWHLGDLVSELVGSVGIDACPSEFKNARPSLPAALDMQRASAGPTIKKNR